MGSEDPASDAPWHTISCHILLTPSHTADPRSLCRWRIHPRQLRVLRLMALYPFFFCFLFAVLIGWVFSALCALLERIVSGGRAA